MVSLCFGRSLNLALRSRSLFPLSVGRVSSLNHRQLGTKIARCEDDRVYDIVVIGGGIVGMATARDLKLTYPSLNMAVLEKECKIASHQSVRNSGVIHAGIYYTPGSLKAKLCVQGHYLAMKYCLKKNVPFNKCGKLIVATKESEIPALEMLFDRGQQNNVRDLKMISGEEIPQIEPHCRGVKAIHSPNTAIVDWGVVTEQFAKDFKDAGGYIYTNFKVIEFKEKKEPVLKGTTTFPVTIITEKNPHNPVSVIHAAYVIVCCGLQSDEMAKLSGGSAEPRILPFRGEYLLLKKEKCHLVNGNIYPVPDARYPFLGVHFTPRMDGSVWLGPNAILALKREGYRYKDIDWKEIKGLLGYPGFYRLAFKYFGFGAKEMLRSAFISLQVRQLRKYVPELRVADVERGPSGVRAQALDRKGNLVDDFVFEVGDEGINKRILHCRNAPSPGATSSLAIAMMISEKAKEVFDL